MVRGQPLDPSGERCSSPLRPAALATQLRERSARPRRC